MSEGYNNLPATTLRSLNDLGLLPSPSSSSFYLATGATAARLILRMNTLLRQRQLPTISDVNHTNCKGVSVRIELDYRDQVAVAKKALEFIFKNIQC